MKEQWLVLMCLFLITLMQRMSNRTVYCAAGSPVFFFFFAVAFYFCMALTLNDKFCLLMILRMDLSLVPDVIEEQNCCAEFSNIM